MARLKRAKEYPADNTEAAAKGHAVHAAIAKVLTEGVSYLPALDYAHEHFFEAADNSPNFRWVKVQTGQTVFDHITRAFTGWYEHVLPVLGTPLHVEHKREQVVYTDDEREITLVGTPDYVDDVWGIVDWKVTDNRDKYGKRDSWMLKRYAVQPTAYTLLENLDTFNYVRLDPVNGDAQWLEVKRTTADHNFLIMQLVNLAKLIEADVKPWPLNDQHGLCSEKWCLNWHDCKGKFSTDTSVTIS